MLPSDHALSGKAALVTGGGTGIGAAVSRRLAVLGASVAVHQRTLEKAQALVQVVRRDGGVAEAVVSDLRSLNGCRDAVNGCLRAFERIDVLVNNAAVTGRAALTPILDMDDEQLDEIVAVNLTAAIRCAHFAAGQMEAGSVIVNIGSVAGYAAQPGCAAYVATKAGLIGLTRALAIDLADRGIRVVHVAPGDIETPTSDGAAFQRDRQGQRFRRMIPIGRKGTPEEIASIVGFVCGDEAGFVTGSSIVADGGYLAY